jgi:hypothetical protein
MITTGLFEDVLSALKKEHDCGQFEYTNLSGMFSSVVSSHFMHIKRLNKYGIYIVRQKSTGEVLYIGKSGTIKPEGKFKGQDIPRRLANVKGDIDANNWFKSLAEEKGDLLIEYVFLNEKPQSPTLVESVLIQSYFNQYGKLPFRNHAF